MSVLFASSNGFVISHEKFINRCYDSVDYNGKKMKFSLRKDLFNIKVPYNSKQGQKKRPSKSDSDETCATDSLLQSEIGDVENIYRRLMTECFEKEIFKATKTPDCSKNSSAAAVARRVYDETAQISFTNVQGTSGSGQSLQSVLGKEYLFPANCNFYCKDVKDIGQHLFDKKYNFIILDPPWWNKFVRRKKRKLQHGYEMMYCDDIKAIPLENLLSDDGLLAVWCTNSQQNLDRLLKDIFEKWNVTLIAKLFWIKVTTTGELICPFAPPKGKQPFEQIILASRMPECYQLLNSMDHKVIVSVPSAIHSHKPPLEEVLKPYLASDLKCLEIFARYLLPNWTSYGFEVLKFQHLSLYEKDDREDSVVHEQ